MFLPWIEAEFEMSENTARRFMDVARVYGSKSSTVADLTPSALYELAAPSTPQPVRDAVDTLLVDGQKVSVAAIRKLEREPGASRLRFRVFRCNLGAEKVEYELFRVATACRQLDKVVILAVGMLFRA